MKPILLAALIALAASPSARSQGPGPFTPAGPMTLPRGSYSPSTFPIVFSGNRDGNPEIYKMNSDGSAARRLTYEVDAEDRDPRISPDGSRIAFTSDRDGNAEIYVMEVDGSSPTLICDSAGSNYAPDW